MGKNGVVRLMIVICSIILQEGIYRILEPERDIEIIAKASTHLQIISLVQQKKPDVLFIDTAIPNLDISKILQSVAEKCSETKILLLLHTLEEEVFVNAITLGVRGYITDLSDVKQFIKAIRAVGNDEIWADSKIITKALTRLLPLKKNEPLIKIKLTKREEEIITLVVLGYRNKQIANNLFISEKTVKNHLGNIFNKLGISNRLNLAINFLSEDISKSSTRTKALENS